LIAAEGATSVLVVQSLEDHRTAEGDNAVASDIPKWYDCGMPSTSAITEAGIAIEGVRY